MTKQKALETIERLGLDNRGYANLKEAINVAIECLRESCDKEQKVENQPCSCYRETTEKHYLSEFAQGIYFAKTGKRKNYTESIVGKCMGTKEVDVCSCGGDCRKCDFYPEKRKKAIREAYPTDNDKELLYWLRTHMTSITRYVFNENHDRDEEYKVLAKKAVDEILFMINGERTRHNTK